MNILGRKINDYTTDRGRANSVFHQGKKKPTMKILLRTPVWQSGDEEVA